MEELECNSVEQDRHLVVVGSKVNDTHNLIKRMVMGIFPTDGKGVFVET